MNGRFLGALLTTTLLVFGCSESAKKAPSAEAVASAKPKAEKAAVKTPVKPVEATPEPEPVPVPAACDSVEAGKGVELLVSPSVNPAMLAPFALNATSMACAKHQPTVALVKTLTAMGTPRDVKRRRYTDGVWQNMGLLERSCHAGRKVLNHIGPVQMDGKAAQVAMAKHCRFVEQGLVTKAELPTLDNGYVPLVPIFQSLMKDSKIDARVQRVLLRGIMGLKSAPLKQ